MECRGEEGVVGLVQVEQGLGTMGRIRNHVGIHHEHKGRRVGSLVREVVWWVGVGRNRNHVKRDH